MGGRGLHKDPGEDGLASGRPPTGGTRHAAGLDVDVAAQRRSASPRRNPAPETSPIRSRSRALGHAPRRRSTSSRVGAAGGTAAVLAAIRRRGASSGRSSTARMRNRAAARACLSEEDRADRQRQAASSRERAPPGTSAGPRRELVRSRRISRQLDPAGSPASPQSDMAAAAAARSESRVGFAQAGRFERVNQWLCERHGASPPAAARRHRRGEREQEAGQTRAAGAVSWPGSAAPRRLALSVGPGSAPRAGERSPRPTRVPRARRYPSSME